MGWECREGSIRRGNGYRYGFNGKENDNEVKGEDNQQDYGMRIYDPRVGRFLSTDPLFKEYPGLTVYQFASNIPIKAIDRDGLETSWRPPGQLEPPKNEHTFSAQEDYRGVKLQTQVQIHAAKAKEAASISIPGITAPVYKEKTLTTKEKIEAIKAKEKRDAAGGFYDTYTLKQIHDYNVERIENSPTNGFPVISNLKKAGKYELIGMHNEAGGSLAAAGVEVAVSYVGGRVLSRGFEYFQGATKASTQTVYRVFGGEAGALGKSWTPINPNSIANYRNAAGLPNVNTGRFVIEGTVK